MAPDAAEPAAKRRKTKDKLRKRDGVDDAVIAVRNAIIEAARAGDAAAAIRAFDTALAAGTRLRPESYNTLLFLCAGGDAWQARFQHLPVPWEGRAAAEPSRQEQQQQSPPTPAPARASESEVAPAELLRRGREILDHMRASAPQAVNEMCFTGLARIAAASGDAAAAFAAAREGREAGVPARLRTYLPALLAFAEAGDAAGAFEVDAAMAAAGLDLTETEFAALLLACAAGATAQQAQGVLGRMGRELTLLSPQTLAAAERFFRSEAAAAMLPEGSARWQVERCTVAADGTASACGGRLQALDLEPAEFEAFAAAIARLAAANEKQPDGFRTFQEWLSANGPFGAILDGANIAFFGQNWEEGGFQFGQIGAAVAALRAEQPGLKPLVLLHARRLKDAPAQEPAARQLLAELRDSKALYATPYGSNDDWYWIYAAVTAGGSGLLVSNDEMRDHIFQLLAPKYVLRWKLRHQMRYKFSGAGLQLQRPAAYTACAQRLATGSWLLPGPDGREWLCARPAPAEQV